LAWSEGRQPLGAVLHLSDELDELLKFIMLYDSTINTVDIIIIIIIVVVVVVVVIIVT